MRSYVQSYAQEFIKVLQETVQQNCPDGCNWIDENGQFVFRADKSSNFKSWAAYNKYPLLIHMNVCRAAVNAGYYEDVEQYDFCDEDVESIFYRWGDPYYRVLNSWKDEFDMCMYELLE